MTHGTLKLALLNSSTCSKINRYVVNDTAWPQSHTLYMSISGIAPEDVDAAREHNTVLEAETAGHPDDAWCAQHGLPDPEICSDVAKHCNETKQAAKVVQVGPMTEFFLHRKTAHCVAISLIGRLQHLS